MLRLRLPRPTRSTAVFRHLCAAAQTDLASKSPDLSADWIAKVLSSLFIHVHPRQRYLGFLLDHLSPPIAFRVVKRLSGDPKVSLEFVRFSRADVDLKHTVLTYSYLIKVLCRRGMVDCAKEVLDMMCADGQRPDSLTFGLLVVSCAELGLFDVAMKLAVRGNELNCKLDVFHWNGLLGLLVKANRVDEAVGFLREHSSYSLFTPNTRTFNVIMKGLCSTGDVNQAYELFHEMGSFGCNPDVVTYNTLIGGLCRSSSEVERGYDLLQEMRSKKRCRPNVVSYTSVISGYCRNRSMEGASHVLEEMVNDGVIPSLITYNVVIDGYSKKCDMTSAHQMYERLTAQSFSPDVVTFTSLIDGYCRSGLLDKAMEIWHDMQRRCIFPNAYTFSIMILALCREGRLSKARNFLRELIEKNIVPKPFMYNPVIDGFCKAGNLDEANLIFEEMKLSGCVPDKMTFTILIFGHCMKGRSSEAIELYREMLRIGCAPDDITENSLVSFLFKAGMPNEAHNILLSAYTKKLDVNIESSRQLNSFKKIMDVPVAA